MRAPIWINFLVFPAAVALKRRTEMNGALLACCHDVTGGFCLWPFKARTSSNGGFFFIRADASADADSIRRFHHPLICIKFGKKKVDWVHPVVPAGIFRRFFFVEWTARHIFSSVALVSVDTSDGLKINLWQNTKSHRGDSNATKSKNRQNESNSESKTQSLGHFVPGRCSKIRQATAQPTPSIVHRRKMVKFQNKTTNNKQTVRRRVSAVSTSVKSPDSIEFKRLELSWWV